MSSIIYRNTRSTCSDVSRWTRINLKRTITYRSARSTCSDVSRWTRINLKRTITYRSARSTCSDVISGSWSLFNFLFTFLINRILRTFNQMRLRSILARYTCLHSLCSMFPVHIPYNPAEYAVHESGDDTDPPLQI